MSSYYENIRQVFEYQPRGPEIVSRIRATARNKTAKPVGPNHHAIIIDDQTAACRLYNTNIITFELDHIILDTGGYDTNSTRHRMQEILHRYNLYLAFYPFGPHRGTMAVTGTRYPSWHLLGGGERFNIVEKWIPINPTVRIDYAGKDVDEKSLQYAKGKIGKEWKKFRNRSNAQKSLQETVKALGFESTFKLNGYKLPEYRDTLFLEMLNKQAQAMGFLNVQDAWYDGVAINSALDEQELTMHRSGMSGLLRDAIGEQNAGYRQASADHLKRKQRQAERRSR